MDMGHEYIRSRDNPRVKFFSKLAASKYRAEERLFLAEGVKLASEAISAGVVKYLLADEEKYFERGDVFSLCESGGAEVIILSCPAFSKVSSESSPQGIIAVCSFPDFHTTSDKCCAESLRDSRLIALDGIRDPGNLGTIIRCAAAFGFDGVIIGDCADVYNTKTVRASMGALFRMRITECGNLSRYLSELGECGRRIIGAALCESSLSLGSFETESSDICVIGNEGHGLSREVLDVCTDLVRIPMEEGSESLNAGVAASVIMWEYYKKRGIGEWRKNL